MVLALEGFGFISKFIGEINSNQLGLVKLSRLQRGFLAFCLSGMLLTNSLNWSAFERLSCKRYVVAALSWMLHHSKIAWEAILRASIRYLIGLYGINAGTLVIDDTNRSRSRSTSKIFGTHRTIDAKGRGFLVAQNLVVLLLVTPKITFPVGFLFYRPDPGIAEWEYKKERGLPAGKKPLRSAKYPKKLDLAISLVRTFRRYFPKISVRGIIADAAYHSVPFFEELKKLCPKSQILSQLKHNHQVLYRGKKMCVEQALAKCAHNEETLAFRGHTEKELCYAAARLYLCAHQKKHLIVAFRYKGEQDFRYLVAYDLSWRAKDIILLYSQRWLIEVFFEDWKQYEGWGQSACQQHVEGSCRGVILSLLLDHCLLAHPLQSARIENNLPACTVGSLRARLIAENLSKTIESLLTTTDNHAQVIAMLSSLKEMFLLRDSQKHLVGAPSPADLKPQPNLL